MHLQTKLFRSIASDHMGPKPVEIARTASVAEAVNGMAQTGSRMAIVTDSHGKPAGVVTEQDVVRRVARQAAPDQPVADVMSAPIVTVSTGDHLLAAITTMRRHRLSRIPVVGALFGQRTVTDNRKEILVLVTPTVIRDPLEARRLTDEYGQRFRGLEPLRKQEAKQQGGQ